MSGSRSIRSIGIVNRGEAAMRCVRAVKTLRAIEGSSLRVLALYTAADREAPFVRHADAAVQLPGRASAAAAYLDHAAVLAALRQGGADAVWPGWGFVAEDPDFADRVSAAGLTFLGPSGATMRRLGDKIAAKELAATAGVPVVPWSGGEVVDVDMGVRCAADLGFPLVVKAAAGGGGRGIRVVESAEHLAPAFASAAAEARAAFGDGRLFIERRITGGRHVEVQIAGDRFGRVVALGCRDCSVQRRHQKLLEEAPPPGVCADRLRALEEAAVRLAAAVGYEGVGTVEFLLTDTGAYFLEVNPRLQVEHGVTEVVSGIDLVHLQIHIARGEPLPDLVAATPAVAIEARVCAEDPDAGFAPAPGRVVRFDAPLGPWVRVDAGVVVGTTVPPDFDSLIAKVIASGATREQARARLVAALRDFEVVIAGGATNKGVLLDVLDAPEYRAGQVDTAWLDRWSASRTPRSELAGEALIAAAVLSYQEARRAVRANFFADTTHVSPAHVPPSRGQQVDLVHRGIPYRLHVFALGSARYRVTLDGRSVGVTLRDDGHAAARLLIGDRSWRVLCDVTTTALRVEIEGRPYWFSRHSAGRLTAATPAVVVAVHTHAGQRVEAGQPLGLLEAMKMEVAFVAPVSGIVAEICVRRGQQVKAGEVLAVITPAADFGDQRGEHRRDARLCLPLVIDPLEVWFDAGDTAAGAGVPWAAAARLDATSRRLAIDALREEVRRVLLGYDTDLARTQWLIAALETPLPAAVPAEMREALVELREEVGTFADLEQLFTPTPFASSLGRPRPSNFARLRAYVRRMRAGGAGLAPGFPALLRSALKHYGVSDLTPSDTLERAVVRLFASQHAPDLRHRLVLAVVRHLTALARSGVPVPRRASLVKSLSRLARLRGLVPDALADAAIEAGYVIAEVPHLERLARDIETAVDTWRASTPGDAEVPPEDLLARLARSPRPVFERLRRWFDSHDPARRAVAVAVHLRWVYGPAGPRAHRLLRLGDHTAHRIDLAGGDVVLALASDHQPVRASAAALCEVARQLPVPARALELLLPGDGVGEETWETLLTQLRTEGLPAGRMTVTAIPRAGGATHRTIVFGAGRAMVEDTALNGLHPETAARVDLARLAEFELARLDSGEDIFSFAARSRTSPDDERVFVLADVREYTQAGGRDTVLRVPAFERAFQEATRALRGILNEHDPQRRLRWNRISLFVVADRHLDQRAAQRIAHRLASATRHLGLEKVVARVSLDDGRAGTAVAGDAVEIVFADPTGQRLEVTWRVPHQEPLRSASVYERNVALARRRGLTYPYEIVRLLTEGTYRNGTRLSSPAHDLPHGSFDEYDLQAGAPCPSAVSVAGRPFGANRAAVVFGVLSTPTATVPEGMRRVLILSDPTMDMGALGAPECDRLVAAIDLAERLRLPVEWVPVSSGARIAMDSGTENLDATARVVRRIVTFTQRGGVIHIIVQGVNVGAQSYFDALSTMLLHTRGVLIMTPGGSMVLTGKAALEASGGVAAEDEVAIGGFEGVMGPNGEAHYYARNLVDAYRTLYRHYECTYVVPSEAGPRRRPTTDTAQRSICDEPYEVAADHGFTQVGDIFTDAGNPGRKKPFAMRAVMHALIDRDAGFLEPWHAMSGAETAIVWETHLDGHPVCLIGIESQNVPREGLRPLDGPASWNGGTLFPLSSKKVARALNAASGNRPVVILANLSGFDGSPESMRTLQLEYGAEIARAVVNFRGPLCFVVVSRYHGGAYVVFSRALSDQLDVTALTGSYASVIGGQAAAAVVFRREVRTRALRDRRVVAAQRASHAGESDAARDAYARVLAEVTAEVQAELAAEFDAVHSVERARDVGSLDRIIPPHELRTHLIAHLAAVRADAERRGRRRRTHPGSRGDADEPPHVIAGW
jgi:acetyl/propionyl-CoA carboxylase alpha subunit/acetyl-CoA carboxylase carboxyltransferase component